MKTNYPAKSRRCLMAALVLLILCPLSGHAVTDRFTLTAFSIDTQDLTPLGPGYAYSSATLGFFLNGHGLPDQHRTYLIVHKSTKGRNELIWPDFDYGYDQPNAAEQEGVLVFTGGLPDLQVVLMAHRAGEPPMVISQAVLRLAARRLGPSVIAPDIDYHFTQIRMPPGRIWLKGGRQPLKGGLDPNPFTLELTTDDLNQVMNETRQRGTTIQAKRFKYIAEPGAASRLAESNLPPIQSNAPNAAVAPKPRKVAPYIPQPERLSGGCLLDPINHYAYFSTVHEPGRILKVALGNEAKTPPKVVGAVVLEPEENNTFHGAIDPEGGYGYWVASGSIVKVALGAGSEPPYRVGSLLLDKNNGVGVGVIDPAAGYGYFTVGRGKLCKIKLGKDNEAPSLVSVLDLHTWPGSVSAVLDPTTHYAYFGSELGKIYKVALGEDDALLRLVGELQLPEDERDLRGALIDPVAGFAWFTSNSGYLVKVSLGEGDNLPVRVGSLKLAERFRYLEHTFGMDNAGYAYFGTVPSQNSDGAVLKIALGHNNELPRFVSSRVFKKGENDFASGIVDPAQKIMCLGMGVLDCSLVKMNLGDGDAPPTILKASKLY